MSNLSCEHCPADGGWCSVCSVPMSKATAPLLNREDLAKALLAEFTDIVPMVVVPVELLERCQWAVATLRATAPTWSMDQLLNDLKDALAAH